MEEIKQKVSINSVNLISHTHSPQNGHHSHARPPWVALRGRGRQAPSSGKEGVSLDPAGACARLIGVTAGLQDSEAREPGGQLAAEGLSLWAVGAPRRPGPGRGGSAAPSRAARLPRRRLSRYRLPVPTHLAFKAGQTLIQCGVWRPAGAAPRYPK